MKITRTFHPTKAWQRLADRFRAYIRRRDDTMGLGFTPQEHVAVNLFLGLNGMAPHLQLEVAEAMNISKQRVRQLLLAALGRIERQRYPRRPE